MSIEQLDFRTAAQHLGLLPEAFLSWTRFGLLPSSNWTKSELDRALARLVELGVQEYEPRGRHDYRPLPNVHRVPRKNMLGMVTYHYFRRGVRGALVGAPGSPEFMRSLLTKERERAVQRAKTFAAHRHRIIQGHAPKTPHVASPSIVVGRKATRSPAKLPAKSRIQPNIASETLLTAEELVQRWRGAVSTGTLKNWRSCRPRLGPSFLKIARSILYPLTAVIAWERAHVVAGEEAQTVNNSEGGV